ncbi:hypothetical protein [Streptomyces sp. Ac-502]|uniref:DUF6197 family protein n=1 Tax=Streptomyces sp. Ac-502 TaxID=3342801 RepID=UPI00386295CA
MTREELAGLLRTAKDYLTEHGWCRGEMNGPNGEVCAAGAIRAVAPPCTRRQTSPEERLAVAALSVHLGGQPVADPDNPIGTHPMERVTAWNDAAKEVGVVLDAFRGVIERLETERSFLARHLAVVTGQSVGEVLADTDAAVAIRQEAALRAGEVPG